MDTSEDVLNARNAMSWLATVALALLHVLYRLALVIKSLSARFNKIPRTLLANCDRSKLPSHLALCLIPDSRADDESNEKYMLNSVVKVATWCQVVGIRRLTVYDREGMCKTHMSYTWARRM